jgi:hypothetical protein
VFPGQTRGKGRDRGLPVEAQVLYGIANTSDGIYDGRF